MMNSQIHSDLYDVITIGAGPSGIACAIEAKKRGLHQLLIEQGGIADAIRRFPTEMHFYSTPEMLSVGALPFVAASSRPTRAEALRYYRSVCTFYELPLRLHCKIVRASRSHTDAHSTTAFEIQSEDGTVFRSKNLVLATGYFDSPIRLGIPGEELPHVSHYYVEPYAFSKTRVLVVGGGNSAVDAALDLFRNGAEVSLIHRGAQLSPGIKYWNKPDIENRIKEGSITASFNTVIEEITAQHVVLHELLSGARTSEAADAVFLLTGYKASLDLLEQLSAECNYDRGEPIHDGNFETSIPGLFCAGSANCGIHTSEIFIENGRTHALQIVPNLRL